MFGLPGRVMRDSDTSIPQASPPVAPVRPAPRENSVQIWGQLFKKQVERCWKKPGNGGKEPVQAIFSIKLKRNGMLEDVRLISISSATSYNEAYQASCLRALIDCQPYKLPEANYDEWRFFESVFTERLR
jgi:colicin import membrane protein